MESMTITDAIRLCEVVLRGEITYPELEQRWPDLPSDPLLRRVREDLFDAVEHTPGDPTTGAVDIPKWKTQPEYDDVRLALRHLRAHRDAES
jgi:hypothetical protein